MGIDSYKTNLQKGKSNTISDVSGVTIGHLTLNNDTIQTGVTIINPTKDNIFQNKLIAANYIINGFGKTTGLLQIDELGVLESPIALTNTLSVGICQQALIKYMLENNADIGDSTGTVNVVVEECNDGYLNDIRKLMITEEHVFSAINNCNKEVIEGSVGAGTGMSCFGMKGGIGSASREIMIDNMTYTIGTLVLTNFGLMKDFIFDDIQLSDVTTKQEKGSCIMIIATDLPLDARQLKRVCKRMSAPLVRTGSYLGNGSGDIAIAFSTKNKIPHYIKKDIMAIEVLHENHMDLVFRASIDAMQESILSSLVHSETTVGRNNHIIYGIKDVLKESKKPQ